MSSYIFADEFDFSEDNVNDLLLWLLMYKPANGGDPTAGYRLASWVWEAVSSNSRFLGRLQIIWGESKEYILS